MKTSQEPDPLSDLEYIPPMLPLPKEKTLEEFLLTSSDAEARMHLRRRMDYLLLLAARMNNAHRVPTYEELGTTREEVLFLFPMARESMSSNNRAN